MGVCSEYMHTNEYCCSHAVKVLTFMHVGGDVCVSVVGYACMCVYLYWYVLDYIYISTCICMHVRVRI